jgi:hypothetical protein
LAVSADHSSFRTIRHLFYNSIMFIPMVIGMYYHMFPPKGEPQHSTCTCEWRPRSAKA